MRTLQMAKKTYHGDGYCLFCRKPFVERDLTDEHIIPEALHGSLVIENGSCRLCAQRSNSEYENKALNRDLQLPRVLLELRGKRGSAVPRDVRHLPAVYPGDTTMGGEQERLLDFPVDMYPKFFNLLHFPPPGKISDVERGANITGLKLQIFNIGGKGLANVTVKQPYENGPFAMMLAKIGYCYAVAEKNYTTFDSSEIRALLNGERHDVYNFVGSSEERTHFSKRHLHSLYFRQRGDYLTVLVHLFASLSEKPDGVLPYEVVVGRL